MRTNSFRASAFLVVAAALTTPPAAQAIDTGYLFAWGTPGAGAGQFNAPTDISIGPSGAVYVLDAGNARIQKFDADGNYLAQWVTSRPAHGAMSSIAATTDGRVYVQATYYIQQFDADGNFALSWGPIGGASSQQHHLASDRLGFLYLTFQSNGFSNTARYSGPNVLAGGFGSGSITYGRIAIDPAGGVFWAGVDGFTGQLRIFKRTSAGAAVSDWASVAVSDLACDASGNLYACEPGNDVVRVYDNAGAELATIGAPGSGPGQFQDPRDVAVGNDGRIYVVDQLNHRVQVFGNASVPAAARSWGRLKAQYR